MDLTPVLAVVGGLLAGWLLFLGLLWLLRPRGVRLGEALRIVPDLLRMVRALIAAGSTPLGVRVALMGLVAWLLNPIDLIPELIPVLGSLDDVVVAVLVLRYVRRRLGEDDCGVAGPAPRRGSRCCVRSQAARRQDHHPGPSEW